MERARELNANLEAALLSALDEATRENAMGEGPTDRRRARGDVSALSGKLYRGDARDAS